MDRQKIEGNLRKSTGATAEKSGDLIGDRHRENKDTAEKMERRNPAGHGDPLDAVRDVVNNEK